MIYPYICEKHGHFDVYRHHTEVQPKEPCPQCGIQARRVFTVPTPIGVGGGEDDVVGQWSTLGEKREKMQLLGVSQKESCGSLAPVKPRHCLEEERVDRGFDRKGGES